jgi:hypothetical protein
MVSTFPLSAMSVAEHVAACFDSFEVLRVFDEKEDVAKSKYLLDEALSRFKIWSSNIGAHRKGSSSLDFRLRDASHIRLMVLEVLKTIKDALSDATNSLNGNENIPELHPQDTTLDDDKSDELDLAHDLETEIHQILVHVLDCVKCLMRLSIAIKHPAPHDRFMKPRDINTSAYEAIHLNHTKSKFPLAKPFLVDRLGKANAKRYMFLKYRQEHRQRLEKDLGPDNQTIASSLPSGAGGITALNDLTRSQNVLADDAVSITSYANTEAETSNSLRVPDIPEGADYDEPFECQICFTIVDIPSRKHWK